MASIRVAGTPRPRSLASSRAFAFGRFAHRWPICPGRLAEEIAAGRLRAALLAGDDPGRWIGHPHDLALGIAEPIQMNPLMETGPGAARGRGRDEHVARDGRGRRLGRGGLWRSD